MKMWKLVALLLVLTILLAIPSYFRREIDRTIDDYVARQNTAGLEAAAEGGSPEAQVTFANKILRKSFFQCPNEQDAQRAIELLRRAAISGNGTAQLTLGGLLLNPSCPGEKRDVVEAEEWLSKAALHGSTEAQMLLGQKYLQGIGVERNLKEALKWLESAAQGGDPWTQSALAHIYWTGGDGVERDGKSAFEWYMRAAAQGYPNAQQWVALIYSDGKDIEKNNEEACFWITLSNFMHAKEMETCDAISPAQRAAINARVLAWKPVKGPRKAVIPPQ